jgi:ribosome-binding protein aMBF1 (putative translation factor)
MVKKHLKHVNRQLTEEERARHSEIRAAAMGDIPPRPGAARRSSPPGIPTKIRQAREARGLTWYALAKECGISNQGIIRDIEQGKDVKLSDLQTVAAVLGLKLDIVEQVA